MIKKIDKDFLLRNYKTKITLYPAYRSYEADYDPEENNYKNSFINPITIKCYIRQLSTESLIFRQYGLKRTGSVEILTDQKYFNHFKYASKIEINNNEYEVFKSEIGQYASLRKGPGNTLIIVLEKKSGENNILPQYSKDVCLEYKKQLRQYGDTVLIYPAYKTKDAAYDPEENVQTINYLNPIPIKCLVSEISGMTNILKEYGAKSYNIKQLVTDKSNLNLLTNSYKLTINEIEYHVLKESVGQKAVIQQEQAGIVRAIVEGV